MGGGPLLWIWPLYLHVNQKSDYDDDDEVSCHRANDRLAHLNTPFDIINDIYKTYEKTKLNELKNLF